jgi:secreted trypsin-like serine protease
MLLKKVLFVSLLVLGLFYLQPAQCENRLNTRLAGGFVAQKGQFPWVALITYSYQDRGITVTYQGTGVIYSATRVLTSANAVKRCANGVTLTVSSGITDIASPAGATVIQVVCNNGTSIVYAPGAASNVYFGDVAYIDLTTATSPITSFAGVVNATLRTPTSSPTPRDINKLYIAGYGENFPEAAPSPQLIYIPINPMTNNLCNQALTPILPGTYKFSENFCVKGQKKDPRTGVVTDACPLDSGAPIFRTSNIDAPYADFEVVGIVNYGTCTAGLPVIATYLAKYLTFLGAQASPPAAAAPPNPNAANGNFICGDGVVQPNSLEKCDTSSNTCCNKWTCQFQEGGFPCGPNNGTKCKTRPICDGAGICKARNKPNKRRPCAGKGKKSRCSHGKCCTINGASRTCV